MLLGVFSNSLTAHAAEHDTSGFNIDIDTLDLEDEDIENGNVSVYLENCLNTTWRVMVPHSTFSNGFSEINTFTHNTKYFSYGIQYGYVVQITLGDLGRMFKKNSVVDLTLSNITDYVNVSGVGNFYFDCKPSDLRLIVQGASGEQKTLHPNYTIDDHGMNHTINIEDVEIPFDVYKLYIGNWYNTDNYTGLSAYYGQDKTMTWTTGFSNTILSVNYADNTV